MSRSIFATATRSSADLAAARVAARIEEGGLPVPEKRNFRRGAA